MTLDLNPYAPPAATDASALSPAPSPAAVSPEVRLFSPSAIATHAILLTPVTGGILATINHRRLGDTRAAWRTAFMYVLPSVVVEVARLVVRPGPRDSVLRLALVLWTILVARMLYREQLLPFRAHVAAGGRVARWYLATLAVLGIVLALFVTAAVVLPAEQYE
jgi:hypothetical protein